jgi:hypothetical protein
MPEQLALAGRGNSALQNVVWRAERVVARATNSFPVPVSPWMSTVVCSARPSPLAGYLPKITVTENVFKMMLSANRRAGITFFRQPLLIRLVH